MFEQPLRGGTSPQPGSIRQYRSPRSRDPDVREGQADRLILAKKRLSVDSSYADRDTLPAAATLAELREFVATMFRTMTGKQE